MQHGLKKADWTARLTSYWLEGTLIQESGHQIYLGHRKSQTLVLLMTPGLKATFTLDFVEKVERLFMRQFAGFGMQTELSPFELSLATQPKAISKNIHLLAVTQGHGPLTQFIYELESEIERWGGGVEPMLKAAS